MKLSAFLQPLIDAKAPHELIMAQVLAFEMQQEADDLVSAEAEEQSKEKARSRWRRWKENHPTNVSKRLQTDTNVSKQLVREGDARGLDNSLTQKLEPQESKKTTDALRDVDEFKAVLSPLLSEEQVAGLLKVRRKKRAVISGHTARLLLGAIARTPLSIPEAADKCIERNWVSIEPEWLPAARGSPPRQDRAPSQSQVFQLIGKRAANGQDGDDSGRLRPALSDLRTG